MTPAIQFARAATAVVRKARPRVAVADIHPPLRHTRLGAILRETAHADPDPDVAELAHQAIYPRGGGYSDPLGTWPLHLLRDMLMEKPDHPLAARFNWEKLPEKVALDEDMARAITAHNQTWSRGSPVLPGTPHHLRVGHFLGQLASGHGLIHAERIRNELSHRHPWAGLDDFRDSARRLMDQANARAVATTGRADPPLPFVGEHHHDATARPESDASYPFGHHARY